MSDYNERAEFLYGIDILDKKPLAQWAQETAYDSASACETAKTQRVTEEHTRYQKSADAYIQSLRAGTDPTALRGQRILAESNYATTAAFVASRCVYSDDQGCGHDIPLPLHRARHALPPCPRHIRWSQVPPHLADSWAKCQEQVHARFGSGAAISFGPATPRLDTTRGVGYLFGVVQGRSSQRFICEMKLDGKAFRVIRVIVEE